MRRRRRQIAEPPRDSARAWLELDTALKERLRAALEPERPVAEWELRKLSDEGRACSLIVGAELERGEQRLAELDSDPASPLAEIAGTFRDVSGLRAELDELHALLGQLQERAREARSSWLSAQSSGPRNATIADRLT